MLSKKPFKKGFGFSNASYYKTVAAPSYTGPGDVVSGATAWGSPARAYTAAFAAGGTAIMDLVDQAGANQVTINILTTGFADLAAISAWVTANSVSTICVKKIYDQTGNNNHFTQATLATMPRLTLLALNGLPGLTGTSAAGTTLDSPNVTVAQPLTEVTVYKRTSLTTNSPALGAAVGNVWIGAGAANLAIVTGTGSITVAGTDNAFHAVQGVFNGASSVNNTDGTENTGSIGTTGFSTSAIKLLRNAGVASLNGTIMEGGVWPIGFSSGQRTSMNANLHGANGYNF